MSTFVCVHGHFYQPPRENPWLDEIEPQPTAHPFHDWNERINAECYAPNTRSPIHDDRGRTVRTVNNYASISFNFGPTLLSWLERHDDRTYQAILAADRESSRRFGGHGSAMAQVYNHVILPLANARDRRTQVIWGLRDFEHRFGRRPEGMWLPETAVDLDSLDALAACGMRFTILAPDQAAAVRALGEDEWRPVDDGSIDTTIPYRQTLPSGRVIDLFFYNGPVSRAVAFEGLLSRSELFIERLLGAGTTDDPQPRLVHIATDGESYGHHHRHGDMALAAALDRIETERLARLTNYGEFLELAPAAHEVRIRERSSWSCAHGLGRWSHDCGCRLDPATGDQRWRAPLRAALDDLRERIVPVWERATAELMHDPWAARDGYIEAVLDRSEEAFDGFLTRHARRALDTTERLRVLRLFELQRHAMLMYTSCGWFFDDVAGLETVQILAYAARALQLSSQLFDETWEPELLTRLELAPGNDPAEGNGRQVWERHVRPLQRDIARLAEGSTA